MSASDSGWSVVARVSTLEAEVLRAALETAEIPVRFLSETVGQIYALTASMLGEVRVLVPEDRAEEARALLADSRPIDFPESD